MWSPGSLYLAKKLAVKAIRGEGLWATVNTDTVSLGPGNFKSNSKDCSEKIKEHVNMFRIKIDLF